MALKHRIIAETKISYAVVLAPPDLPISITPCLASLASYSQSIFSFCLGLNYKFRTINSESIAASSRPYLTSESSNPGNKSDTSPLNNGKSAFISFGSVENYIARMRIQSSFQSGSWRFNEPAAIRMAFSERSVQSQCDCLESCKLHRANNEVSFYPRTFASLNPSDQIITSAISLISGTTIDIGLNSCYKFSGNSERPAQPGFIVIHMLQFQLSGISLPSNINLTNFLETAAKML